MKKLIRQTTLSAALAMAAVGAWAQQNASPVYGEIGWTQINYKEAGYSIKPGMVRAMVGMEVHPNLAIEGMLGLGISDDIINIRGVSVTGEVNNAWGVFMKPKAAVTPNLEVFGRLGYTKTKVTASVPGYSLTDSGGDVAYGLGLSYRISDKTSINADYMSYYNKDGVKGTGVTVGLGFRF